MAKKQIELSPEEIKKYIEENSKDFHLKMNPPITEDSKNNEEEA